MSGVGVGRGWVAAGCLGRASAGLAGWRGQSASAASCRLATLELPGGMGKVHRVAGAGVRVGRSSCPGRNGPMKAGSRCQLFRCRQQMLVMCCDRREVGVMQRCADARWLCGALPMRFGMRRRRAHPPIYVLQHVTRPRRQRTGGGSGHPNTKPAGTISLTSFKAACKLAVATTARAPIPASQPASQPTRIFHTRSKGSRAAAGRLQQHHRHRLPRRPPPIPPPRLLARAAAAARPAACGPERREI